MLIIVTIGLNNPMRSTVERQTALGLRPPMWLTIIFFSDEIRDIGFPEESGNDVSSSDLAESIVYRQF